MTMNIQNSNDVRFAVGYFKPGEAIDKASAGTKFLNWLAGTSLGKNVFKMDPPKCLCVRDANTGRHIATDITTARFGQFAKVDLSGDHPSKVSAYTPPPSKKDVPIEQRGSGAKNVDQFHGPVKNERQLTQAKMEIAAGFGKDFWNRDQMTVALWAKMASRQEKGGPPIHALVAQFDPENPKGCELGKILDGVKQGIKSGEVQDGTRFQVAVQDGAHWTAIDCKIMNGEPHFFVMDAAQSMTTTTLCESILKEFPKGRVYEYNNPKGVKQLQFDDNSCSRFTLDHLSVMSRDGDFFERLDTLAQSGTFKNIDHDGFQDLMVPPQHLPPGTFRMLQSHTMLDKLDDGLKNRISSPSKQKTDYQQALGNTVIDFEREKIMNVLAESKKESFATKALDFLEGLTLEQFNTVMTSRAGEGLVF